MVGPADLPNAVALNSSMFQTTRLVGPALGGLAIATLGTSVCFFLNAISFIAVLVGLFLMDPTQLHPLRRPPRRPMLKQLGEGLHYSVTTPDIFIAIITMAVLGTFGYNFQVFTPLVANEVLHTNSVGFGLLNSALAVGSLVAALGVAWRGGATRRVMLLGAGSFSVVLFVIGLSSSWLLLVPLFIGLGLSSSVFTATNRARLQLLTPTELQGRVMGISTLLFAGSTPIGSLIVGGMAEQVGVQPTVVLMGSMCILGVVAALIYQRRMRDRLTPDGADFDEPERLPEPVLVPAGLPERNGRVPAVHTRSD
jgi:MFS family permease